MTTLNFPATVTDVFERKLRKLIPAGPAPDARFSANNEGWYIQIDGMVSIFVGAEKPDFEIDQAVVLSIRKVT